MKSQKVNKTKIKRRNFFYYIGAAAGGVFAFSKLPYRFIVSSVKDASRVKIKSNPYAVKREEHRIENG